MCIIEINKPAPDFNIDDYKGKQFTLNEFIGKNILIVLNRGFV
jgi:peroxiredoxin